jgi:hypothetical protein
MLTPDAATWAKELRHVYWETVKEWPPDSNKDWLAVAQHALTLHAQAVAAGEEFCQCGHPLHGRCAGGGGGPQ